jgi:hypothetical protein
MAQGLFALAPADPAARAPWRARWSCRCRESRSAPTAGSAHSALRLVDRNEEAQSDPLSPTAEAQGPTSAWARNSLFSALFSLFHPPQFPVPVNVLRQHECRKVPSHRAFFTVTLGQQRQHTERRLTRVHRTRSVSHFCHQLPDFLTLERIHPRILLSFINLLFVNVFNSLRAKLAPFFDRYFAIVTSERAGGDGR